MVRSIRNARAEYKVEAGKAITAHIVVSNNNLLNQFKDESAVICLLGRLSDQTLTISSKESLNSGKI